MFYRINISEVIRDRMRELGLDADTLSRRTRIPHKDLMHILDKGKITTVNLLSISKILEYDFFRIYSMHLILYAPPLMNFDKVRGKNPKKLGSQMPSFRKNAYTPEMIQFVLEKISRNQITISDALRKYGIPKTTLYRWVKKYSE